ncbi:MAG: hypothetical protein KF760_05265 [Candidatus Eremiobacteraeota bacterium]|nr:hypothetical protein [Candidatus Eremiobacteraeota bacterium]MCW5867181.1 hypothetical protein [Candidatus Eremiobacteraeota bacterium]
MMMLMRREGEVGGQQSFRITLPSYKTWGGLKVTSGNPLKQVLTKPADWVAGYPIPEGLYLVGPLDVAGWLCKGKPDWAASFDVRMPGPIYRDLIPARRLAAKRPVNYCLRAFTPAQAEEAGSDVYLQSQSDWERLYEWSTRTTIDLLAVDYGLGSAWDLDPLAGGDHTRVSLLAAGDF